MVEPTEREPGAQAHRQLDDLRVGVAALHPVPELVVQAVVVHGVPLGVLRGEPGPVVERRRGPPVGDRLGERLLDLDAVALGAPVLAEQAAVDLGDPQPGGLELAQPEGRVLVDRHRELRGGDADARHHLAPDVHDRVLVLGHVDDHGVLLRSGVRRPVAGVRGTSRPS